MGSSLFIILVFVRGARDWVGSIDVKGSFLGFFFGFCGRLVDWGGNKGWMDGWMEIGEGIGGVDLGPLFFSEWREEGQCCTKLFFPKMQSTHRRLFSGTGC